MKFNVNRTDLNQAVNIVAKAASSKDILDVLGGVLLEVKNNLLCLTGSNLELTIQCSIDCQVEQDGSVILPASVFSDIVRKADGEELSIEVDYSNYRTKITGESFEAELAGLPGVEYPEVAGGSYEQGFSVNSMELEKMLDYTVYAAAKDDMRPIFTGVLLDLKEDRLMLAATDGFRITSIQKPIFYKGTEQKLILPGNNAAEILRLLQSSDAYEVIFSFGSNQIAMDIEGIKVYSKLIDGQYPDITQYLPKEYHSEIVLSSARLDMSLERATSIVRDSKKGIVTLSSMDEYLTVHARAADLGQHTEEIMIDKKGQDVKVSFTLRYLRELVKHNDQDRLVFKFAEKYNMLVAHPEGSENCFSLLMPVAGRD